jgi:hypothetical protein
MEERVKTTRQIAGASNMAGGRVSLKLFFVIFISYHFLACWGAVRRQKEEWHE